MILDMSKTASLPLRLMIFMIVSLPHRDVLSAPGSAPGFGARALPANKYNLIPSRQESQGQYPLYIVYFHANLCNIFRFWRCDAENEPPCKVTKFRPVFRLKTSSFILLRCSDGFM